MTTSTPIEPVVQPAPPAGSGVGMLVSYTPVAMAQRTAKLGRAILRRVIGFAISLAITVAFFIFYTPEPNTIVFWLLISSAVISLGQLVFSIVRRVQARRATGRIPLGPAFQIDDKGIVLATVPEGERIGWPDVRLVKGRNKFFDPGPRLEFAWADDQVWSVPIIALDAPPVVLDSAFRAFSLGRFGFDLSSVDDIW